MLSEQLRGSLAKGGDRAPVEAALKALLGKVNAQVEEHEQLAFIAVVKETWQIENGFLTPTMKIKRGVIEDTYASPMQEWYQRSQRVVWG
jgi:long-subunit acyl-CoA synthetase (AMP-forming)